jgi:hypothetical protein
LFPVIAESDSDATSALKAGEPHRLDHPTRSTVAGYPQPVAFTLDIHAHVLPGMQAVAADTFARLGSGG